MHSCCEKLVRDYALTRSDGFQPLCWDVRRALAEHWLDAEDMGDRDIVAAARRVPQFAVFYIMRFGYSRTSRRDATYRPTAILDAFCETAHTPGVVIEWAESMPPIAERVASAAPLSGQLGLF